MGSADFYVDDDSEIKGFSDSLKVVVSACPEDIAAVKKEETIRRKACEAVPTVEAQRSAGEAADP